MRSLFSFVILVLGLAAAPTLHAQSCTTSWINPSGGNWTTASNWSSGLPNANSNACINLPGTYSVALTGNVTRASLTLGAADRARRRSRSAAYLRLEPSRAPWRPRARLEWTSGDFAGTGALTSEGTFALTGASGKVHPVLDA